MGKGGKGQVTLVDRVSFEVDRFLSRSGAARFVSLAVVAVVLISFCAILIFLVDDVPFISAFWWCAVLLVQFPPLFLSPLIRWIVPPPSLGRPIPPPINVN